MTFLWRSAVVVLAAVLGALPNRCIFYQRRETTTKKNNNTVYSTPQRPNESTKLDKGAHQTGILTKSVLCTSHNDDPLFKPNFDEWNARKVSYLGTPRRDNLKYDGELATGDAGNKGKTMLIQSFCSHFRDCHRTQNVIP
jgi:hypothetical protein